MMKGFVGAGQRKEGAEGEARQKKTGGGAIGMTDNRPEALAQRQLKEAIQGEAVQRAGEEDELMQGKFSAQRQPGEEEKLMQGKLAAQRQTGEEEELMQGKFSLQRSEGPDVEEALQG